MSTHTQTAVITGASSGIGVELARLLAADGYALVISARRTDRLQQLAQELGALHGTPVTVVASDLAQPGAGAALWNEIAARAPRVDVLVNNAGVGDTGHLADASPETLERMIQLNVLSLTSLTRQALPGMMQRRQGRILNVSSLAGLQPGGPGMAVYYASKSYVLSFSRGIRRELSGTGVSVTTLCPGVTATEFGQVAQAQHTRLFNWTKPMSAQAVALAGYRGLQSGRALVVPGLLNKILATSAKLAPTAIGLEFNRLLLARD